MPKKVRKSNVKKPYKWSDRAYVTDKKERATKKHLTISNRTTKTGREIWEFDADGDHRRIVTSETSAKAMSATVVRYKRTLKRLAER